MSITKYNSEITAPVVDSVGVLPGENENTMIVIAKPGVDVYGKSGGSWELIGSTTADDKVIFVPFASYSEAYFHSTSGEVEVVRSFFFFDSLVKSAAPAPTSVTELGDMPSFSSADAGKVLSVDVNGNLVWIAR